MERKIEVGLSVLNVGTPDLKKVITEAIVNGIDYLHLDMTDGDYVKNSCLGLATIKEICSKEKLRTKVHLMVFNPEKYLDDFATEEVYVHFYATTYFLDFVRKAEERNLKKGLVISPSMDFRETYKVLKYFDEILFMVSDSGSDEQAFLKEASSNLQDFVLNRPLEGGQLKKITLGIEGGINEKNYKTFKAIGVTDFVVGSAYLTSKDKKAFVQKLKYG